MRNSEHAHVGERRTRTGTGHTQDGEGSEGACGQGAGFQDGQVCEALEKAAKEESATKAKEERAAAWRDLKLPDLNSDKGVSG